MFNAPLTQPDHARRAIRAALEMSKFADDFAARQQSRSSAFGTTRIGINTGRAIVGNFGGKARFDYTAHGDAINIAARLEAANKEFGTRILISKATREAAPDIVARPLGALTLRGKSAATEVFEPLAAENPRRLCLFRPWRSGDRTPTATRICSPRSSPDSPSSSPRKRPVKACSPVTAPRSALPRQPNGTR